MAKRKYEEMTEMERFKLIEKHINKALDLFWSFQTEEFYELHGAVAIDDGVRAGLEDAKFCIEMCINAPKN